MGTILAFVFMFSLLVFIHELGHLIFAKRAGMLAREFAIGFGPKIFNYRKNETLYTVRLLPLGGYVRVAGDDPEIVEIKPGHHVGLEFNEDGKVAKIVMNNKTKHPNARVIEVERADLDHELVIRGFEPGEEERLTFSVDPKADFVMDGTETQIAPFDRQFGSKSVPQRAMQLFAGPMMNFLLAIVIFIIIGFTQGIPVDEAKLGSVNEGSPAASAGLQEGDEIIQVGEEPVDTWGEFTEVIRANPNEELGLRIKRDGSTIDSAVTPAEVTQQGQTIGQIGVMQATEVTIGGTFKYSLTQTYEYGTLILTSVGKLITGQFSIDQLSGPVGIYNATDQVIQNSWSNYLPFVAFVSINLGIMNLLPLPALDGGRLLFVGIEAVRGKPIDPQKEGVVHFIGFALLFLLMIMVTWNDIQRLF
ncbi:metalloprotease RseP [Pontibacillus halophilus JSM 076056 = DSM 19796]|uniref:Zinc metalloprotease n=1 Tax=Pontibacillus halophilus JSM 076056 = DSM 19796 TaxID=1385510 RepID=A0A0A5GMD8_9BACI|nr:RIP metalloprotease RseP [Pontibacillus halophilus]KGX93139.1 metalloprotease RseP [Pontibacillus halophilus JSM 076056 = DSM 19796]